MINPLNIPDVFNKKKGFCFGQLSNDDYKLIIELIENHFKKLIKKSKSKNKANINLNNYHKFYKDINHSQIFTKRNRLLGKTDCRKIMNKTKLFQDLNNIFGNIFITDEESIGYSNIYWRCVRPKPFIDVGPFHKDKWFWDLGCGKIDNKYKRVKVWISILSNNNKLGFRFVKGSVARNYKYTSEFRHNLVKPVFNDKQIKKSDIKSFYGKKGSLIVFNDELLHGGEVIKSNKCRVSLEFTFCFNKKKKLN